MDLQVPEQAPERDDFFVAGGTLRADAVCYVPRAADDVLFKALSHAEFCYVLNPRQIGKSSLMVQTTRRLREAGADVVVIDLTSIGRNLSLEQWYFGLLNTLGGQLGARKELVDFWSKNAALGPLNRWFQAIDNVLLKNRTQPLVIFIDEIDYVRSLPFRSDEFFAAIRDCYNRRSLDTQFKNLTFCLLGVATPAELIADARMTPFNIGKRVELEDFTIEEAAPLAAGLSDRVRDGKKLLTRIIEWTGGHPYLTQRLCHAVAADPEVTAPAGVDKTCQKLFLSEKARTVDDNFAFVRHRLLNSAANPADLLDVYQQVLTGKAVRDEEADPMVGLLKLSGVVASRAGRLHVRNRIYRTVFDKKWVLENLPDAEKLRAKRAFWRGLTLAGGVAVLVTVVIGAIAVRALGFERDAENRLAGVIKQSQKIATEREELRRQVYGAKMKFADIEYTRGNIGATRETLAGLIPQPGHQDYRGFEWHRLWKLTSDRSSLVLAAKDLRPNCVSISEKGDLVIAGGADARLTLWRLPGADPINSVPVNEVVTAITLSPDASNVAVGFSGGRVKFLSVPALKEIGQIDTGHRRVSSISNLQGGSKLAVLNIEGFVSTWDIKRRQRIAHENLGGTAGTITVSPNQNRLAVSGLARDFHTALFQVNADGTLRKLKVLPQTGGGGIAFSPDGTKVIFGDSAGHLFVADSNNLDIVNKASIGRMGILSIGIVSKDQAILGTTLHELQLFSFRTMSALPIAGHAERATQLSATRDGSTIASGSSDGTVRIWDLPFKSVESPIEFTHARVRSLKFSRDGKALVSGESDGAVIYREFPSGKRLWHRPAKGDALMPTDIDPSGKYVVAATLDGRLEVLSAATGTVLADIKDIGTTVVKVLFSPDDKYLAAVTMNGTGHFYEVGTWKVALKTSLSPRSSQVTDAAWSPDSDSLALSSLDQGMSCFNLKSRTVQKLGEPGHFTSVAFHPDKPVVAGARESGRVSMWNITTDEKTDMEGGAPGALLSMSFSPDGRTLAGTGESGAISLWNVASHMQVGTIKADKVRSFALAFSPDGRHLVSGGVDHTIRLWSADGEPEPKHHQTKPNTPISEPSATPPGR